MLTPLHVLNDPLLFLADKNHQQKKSCGEPFGFILSGKSPVPGSSADLHDVRNRSIPNFRSSPSFIPGSRNPTSFFSVCAEAYFIKFLERRDVIISQRSQGISSCLQAKNVSGELPLRLGDHRGGHTALDFKVNSSRGNPINGSSGFLFFKKHGNLFLYGDSHQRFPVLLENCSLGDTCEAQLLDSGNLVLVQDRSKGIVWKSCFGEGISVSLLSIKTTANIDGLFMAFSSTHSRPIRMHFKASRG
uniref:Bulb-type lectin domain-containing protein n=1 Tax=Salix viminalis TaxID=40686 RepID=A0A6N2MWZ0_SALVM